MSGVAEVFPAFPHKVTVNPYTQERVFNAIDWMKDQFDNESWRYWGAGDFVFENDRDAVAFKLTWGVE